MDIWISKVPSTAMPPPHFGRWNLCEDNPMLEYKNHGEKNPIPSRLHCHIIRYALNTKNLGKYTTPPWSWLKGLDQPYSSNLVSKWMIERDYLYGKNWWNLGCAKIQQVPRKDNFYLYLWGKGHIPEKLENNPQYSTRVMMPPGQKNLALPPQTIDMFWWGLTCSLTQIYMVHWAIYF